MPIPIPVPARLAAVASILLLAALAAHAGASNKWRLQLSGKANSDGVIEFRITPVEGDPITVEVNVKNNTGENGVARHIVKELRAQLPKDRFQVERDDGEDVLVKKRLGEASFDLEIVSNSVKGVRINPDRE